MKKRLTILLCSITLVMSGCNNADKYKVNEGTQPSSSNIDATTNAVIKFPDYTYEQEKAQIQCASRLAISPKGYYYTASQILYFYDIEHDLNVALCSDAGCKHNGNNCAAHVFAIDYSKSKATCNCDGNEIYYYNGKLYVVEKNEVQDYFLVQYDSNFNNKENIAKVASYSEEGTVFNSNPSCLISESYMYYCTYSYDIEDVKNKNYGRFSYDCMRIKLEVGATPEKLGEFEFPGDYSHHMGEMGGVHVLISGDDIYYIAGGTSRFHATEEEVQCRVAKYSKASGAFEILWSHIGDEAKDVWGNGTDIVDEINNNACMDEEGNLYLLSKAKEDSYIYKNIIKINFNNKTSEKIYTSQGSIDQMAYDGEYLYIIDIAKEQNLLALDMKGNIVCSYKIDYAEKYEELIEMQGNPKAKRGIMLYGVDDRYIVLGATVNAYDGMLAAGFSSSYEGRIDVEYVICGVGVIDKEKLFAGEDVSIKQIFQYGGR